MKNRTEKLITLVTTLLAVLVMTAVVCQAQVQMPIQDCCQQAINLNSQLNEMARKYNHAVGLLNETRAAGDKLIEQKNTRIGEVAKEANAKLTAADLETARERAGKAKSDSLLSVVKWELRSEKERKRPLWIWFNRKKWMAETLKRIEQ